MILKKYILFFVLAVTTLAAKAQSGYNYEEFAVGIEGSLIRGYTNLERQEYHPAVGLSIVYNYNPYFPIAAEFQTGTLSGGGLTVDKDRYGRKYTNKYTSLVFHADFQLGSGIDYSTSSFRNIAKNFFVGSGVGFVLNNNTVQRTNVIAANGPTTGPDVYIFPGKDKSVNVFIPIRIGYEFKIYDDYNEPGMAIDIGYTHNLVFGEGLDGYNDPTAKFKNNATNQYSQIFVTFKYNFGRVVAFNKLIREFN